MKVLCKLSVSLNVVLKFKFPEEEVDGEGSWSCPQSVLALSGQSSRFYLFLPSFIFFFILNFVKKICFEREIERDRDTARGGGAERG